MSIRVLYFARSRELTRCSQETIGLDDIRRHTLRNHTQEVTAHAHATDTRRSAPAASTATSSSATAVASVSAAAAAVPAPVPLSALMPFLLTRHADLHHLPQTSLLLAYNQEMVAPDDASIMLQADDEIALIQPISGG